MDATTHIALLALRATTARAAITIRPALANLVMAMVQMCITRAMEAPAIAVLSIIAPPVPWANTRLVAEVLIRATAPLARVCHLTLIGQRTEDFPTRVGLRPNMRLHHRHSHPARALHLLQACPQPHYM